MNSRHAIAPHLAPITPITLFGGTFDPVHFGHLRVATDTATALQLPEVRLVPSKSPVHRASTAASTQQRLDMLRLAVRDWPGLAVDDCEIKRESASYTIHTLEAFRAAHPDRALIWLIGVDAFLKIQSWHRANALFDFAHFVVLNRPGFATANVFSAALADVWQGRVTTEPAHLSAETHGRIYLHTVTPQAISATEIRNMIQAGSSDEAIGALLPTAVLAYIRAHRLYLA